MVGFDFLAGGQAQRGAQAPIYVLPNTVVKRLAHDLARPNAANRVVDVLIENPLHVDVCDAWQILLHLTPIEYSGDKGRHGISPLRQLRISVLAPKTMLPPDPLMVPPARLVAPPVGWTIVGEVESGPATRLPF